MTPHFFVCLFCFVFLFFSFLASSLTRHLLMVKFSERNKCWKIFARTSLNGIKEKPELFYENNLLMGVKELFIKSFQVYEVLNQNSN